MLSATITVLSAPVAFPDSAQAVSWQERIAGAADVADDPALEEILARLSR